jgi:ankyrin repeat protein
MSAGAAENSHPKGMPSTGAGAVLSASLVEARLRDMFATAVDIVCPKWRHVLVKDAGGGIAEGQDDFCSKRTAGANLRRRHGKTRRRNRLFQWRENIAMTGTPTTAEAPPIHDLTCHVPRIIFWAAWREQLLLQQHAPSAKPRTSGIQESAEAPSPAAAITTTVSAHDTRNKHNKKRKRSTSSHPSSSTTTALSDRTVEIVSDYGSPRRVTVLQLADLLLAALPSEMLSRPPSIISDMRISSPGNTGCINIVTALLFRSAGAQGFVLCPTCGHFMRGEQGLWWHQKMNHGSDHTAAKTVAQEQLSKMALVPYGGGEDSAVAHALESARVPQAQAAGGAQGVSSSSSSSSPSSSSYSSVSDKARQALAPGFEAARDGDLQALRTIVAAEAETTTMTTPAATTTTPNARWDPVTSVDRIHGSTALMWAAGAGHVDVCRFLVEECGADPLSRQKSRRSFGGRTALHWAARRGHLKVCRYLVEGIPPEFDEVNDDGNMKDARRIIVQTSRCCPVDVPTDDGTTAFCWAAWQGHMDVMQYLIAQGADPNAMNRHGCNAAMWSVQGAGGVPQCEYLRDVLGCAFDKINRNGHGTVHKAAQRGKQRLAEWLLTPAEVSHVAKKKKKSRTGCHRTSCGLGHVHVGRDSEGFTPSGLAAIEGFAELSAWLKVQEARLALVDDYGSS